MHKMQANKEPYNSADEDQVKARKTSSALQIEKQNEELKAICADKRTRDFLWRLIGKCGVYQQAFTGNSTTFFNEGKRDIGLWLITELMKADPKIYSLMRLEHGDD